MLEVIDRDNFEDGSGLITIAFADHTVGHLGIVAIDNALESICHQIRQVVEVGFFSRENHFIEHLIALDSARRLRDGKVKGKVHLNRACKGFLRGVGTDLPLELLHVFRRWVVGYPGAPDETRLLLRYWNSCDLK